MDIDFDIHLIDFYYGKNLLFAFLTKSTNFGRIDLFCESSKSLQIFFIAKVYTCSLVEKSLKLIRMSHGAAIKIFHYFLIFLGTSCTHLPQQRELSNYQSDCNVIVSSETNMISGINSVGPKDPGNEQISRRR